MDARYSNFFRVGRNAYELVIEFGQLYQREEAPRMHTRIVTSLPYARELLQVLQESLEAGSQGEGAE
jgi:hypothetical protein